MPPWGTPARDARPAFSHVHSAFEAGQKGPLLGQNGQWIRHVNATMVVSFHGGCPVQAGDARKLVSGITLPIPKCFL